MPKKHPRRYNSSKAAKSLTKRIPPSIPKCVKACPEHNGYITDFIAAHGINAQFLFKKVPNGYDVYLRKASDIKWSRIKSDILFSPATRSLFKTQPTLSKAIDVTESWIGSKFPDIR